MKRLLLILTFINGLAIAANAQIAGKSPEQRASHITKVLQRRLNLTRAQASQINSAFLSRATRMDSLKNHLSPDEKLNQLTRKSIALSTQKQVISVLNDDQKRKLIQLEKMMKEKRRERRPQAADLQG